ncbi:DMT family transporter [Rhodovastum atsumiense]|uniref:DMT family transporter n=1 Tax=Rhodovastum atsumiense TaxID=504468 RepID=A0A5M6ILI7_9PROT|nr:DMT family transporter [Rhodovastum atsumiense]KAA5608797.1 DMT family transporter [Rhodovastum atsumiense]CAH2600870.1 DMT family transporter [Rhodovastum atsumiense]
MQRLWRTAWLLMLTPPLFWSGNFITGRAVRDAVPPVSLAFWRWVGALAIALPFAWPHLARDLPVLRRHWVITLALATTGIAAFNTMVYTGLRTTTALNGVLLQSAIPLCILLWAVVLFGDRPRTREITGTFVSMAGVLVIAGEGSFATLAALSFNTGDLWVFGAVVAYALYTALLRRRPVVHPLSFLVASFVLGLLVLLPFYLAELAAGRHILFSTGAVAAMAYVAVFPSFLAYLAFNRGVELIGPARAGQYVHLMPIFGTLLAVVFLGEHVHLYHAAGIGLIAAGLVMAQRRRA